MITLKENLIGRLQKLIESKGLRFDFGKTKKILSLTDYLSEELQTDEVFLKIYNLNDFGVKAFTHIIEDNKNKKSKEDLTYMVKSFLYFL